MSRITERRKHPYWKVLEESLKQIEGLSDAAIKDLLSQFSTMRGDLKVVLSEYADLSGLDRGGLLALQNRLDDIIYDAAEEMRRNGMQAQQRAWAFGEESARREVAFGTAVQAGTTPEGWAYYYPDEVAPWAGFAVIPPQAEIVKQQIVRASTFEKITLVTDQMRQGIVAQVMNGAVGGLAHHEVMANITHIVGIRSNWYFQELGTTGVSSKAENIFRTEIMTAQNFGKQSALRTLVATDERFKALVKIWLSTGDDRTRDSHIDAHGQVVPIDDVFTVGGQSCMFPLDPILPLRERARCRCTHAPHMPEWGPADELLGPLNEQIEAEKERRSQ